MNSENSKNEDLATQHDLIRHGGCCHSEEKDPTRVVYRDSLNLAESNEVKTVVHIDAMKIDLLHIDLEFVVQENNKGHIPK